MDNWNDNNYNGTSGDESMENTGNPIGYEGGTDWQSENETGSRKRNYERYMDGEVWTPNSSADGMAQQGFEGGAQSNNQYGNQYNDSYNNAYAPVNNPSDFAGLEEPVSVGEWIIVMLLMMIPCVNIILMFVWAFGSSEKKSKSNYFKASLIMAGVIFAFYFVLILIFGMAGFASAF